MSPQMASGAELALVNARGTDGTDSDGEHGAIAIHSGRIVAFGYE